MQISITEDWEKAEKRAKYFEKLYNDNIILHRQEVERLNLEIK